VKLRGRLKTFVEAEMEHPLEDNEACGVITDNKYPETHGKLVSYVVDGF
jgi:hypothetical protein